MFYDADHSLWYMVVFWTTVTVLFGVALHIALKLARIELERAEEIVVIVVSSLVALIPAIGPYLAFIVAIFLIYRMADSSLGMVIGAVIITRFFAMIIGMVSFRRLEALGVVK
jgi:hypothetical protein